MGERRAEQRRLIEQRLAPLRTPEVRADRKARSQRQAEALFGVLAGIELGGVLPAGRDDLPGGGAGAAALAACALVAVVGGIVGASSGRAAVLRPVALAVAVAAAVALLLTVLVLVGDDRDPWVALVAGTGFCTALAVVLYRRAERTAPPA